MYHNDYLYIFCKVYSKDIGNERLKCRKMESISGILRNNGILISCLSECIKIKDRSIFRFFLKNKKTYLYIKVSTLQE